MQRFIKPAIYAAAFLLPPALVGYSRLQNWKGLDRFATSRVESPAVAPAAYDPQRRTVAILLSAEATQITDVLAPYEMFARAGQYNVYTVAPERKPALLTNGLRIMPHAALSELPGRPDIVVVPNLIGTQAAANHPVIQFIRDAAADGALIFSWCTGAEAVAEAGLLDGLTATAHWGDLPRLEKLYPRVKWTRGVRWIDHDSIVASAGLTSGIDATLRVIARLSGDSVAARVAGEMKYPNLAAAYDPAVEQYEATVSKDGVFLLNAMYRMRPRIGVRLAHGMSESDIGYLYDAHVGSAYADVYAVADAPVVSAFGLTIVPDFSSDDARARSLDRIIDPSFTSDDFGIVGVLQDLASTADEMTARFAQRRLEYRGEVPLQGSIAPWTTLATPLVLGLLGILTVIGLSKLKRSHALALAVLLVASPRVATAQSAAMIDAGTRIRVDVLESTRGVLHTHRQHITGNLMSFSGDTLVLSVEAGAEISIPKAAIRDLYISRGMPNRFESAARRAILPAVAAGAFKGLALSLDRKEGDPAPLEGALQRAASAALFSGAIGFVFRKERWSKLNQEGR